VPPAGWLRAAAHGRPARPASHPSLRRREGRSGRTCRSPSPPSRSAPDAAKRALFRARRAGSLHLPLFIPASRDSVHLSLALGPHLTPGVFFFPSCLAATRIRRGRVTGVRGAGDATAGRRVLSASGGACWSNGAKKHAPAVLATAAVCNARPVRPPGIVPSSPQRQTGSSLVGDGLQDGP
jgi:hypothetical protein